MQTSKRRVPRLLAGGLATSALVAVALVGNTGAALADPGLQDGPEPTTHTQEAFAPDADFTSKWTRADAKQLKRLSDPTAPSRENSMPAALTMPTVPQDFPDMSDGKVWVWDTWPLTDEDGNQYSVNGQEIIFSLVADRNLGFDDRHVFAKIGYFYRPAGVAAADRPENGGWTYGGLVFKEGVTGQIFEDQSYSHQTQWSGSARVSKNGEIKLFFTDVAFYRDAAGNNIKPYDPRIALSVGKVHAGPKGVSFTGFNKVTSLLEADGTYYQTGAQNEFFNFRDPFTFEDPAHPGETYMVFEGNSAMPRESATCDEEDLGYQAGDPHAESVDEVNASGATYQIGNIGLAKAKNKDLTEWEFLPPILSANCVTDQTERPQFVFKDGKYYLFTISHRGTFASGIDGPEGVYGFVGNGIRSDFQPLNGGSGLALGNPTNLNFLGGQPFAPDYNQHPGHFQAYSHYVMPGGLVQSFIDTIGTHDDFVRGGTLAPTVKMDIGVGGDPTSTAVDYSYGAGGLGGWADIPANRHLFTTGKQGASVSDEAAQQIRAAVGPKLDDYLAGKPVPAGVKKLIEKLLAQYGG
ncbi:glycoside hydrolase family 68 protein [Microbacterium sp. SS28]|uniref:glycoside hydrolase family 68 protein n=1 Tax=Microbacterium sp. SS28 TaxID=2919948 RepID=UPI001FAA7BCC|nr:glycoside hydrolase family 68 protein [Microbacterium sp. SS28]